MRVTMHPRDAVMIIRAHDGKHMSDDLLSEAKLLATTTRRSLGFVIDDPPLASEPRDAGRAARYLDFSDGAGGLQPGVNLDDKEASADLLGDNALP